MTDRNKNRPGYKETKVGWIPKEWKFLRYEEAFSTIIDGTHFSPKSTSGPRRYITSRNIKYGSMDLRNCAWISEEEHLSIYKRCPVKLGQLLLTKDGAKAGNACINPLTEDFSLLSSVAVLDGRPGTTINIFALQWILSPRGQFSLLSEVSGQAITRLTLDIISSVHIPLPSLPEQKAIAEVLSCWDEGIETLEQLIDAKKLRKKGLMQKLLTGTRRLPGFSEEWEEVQIKDLLKEVKRAVDWDDNDTYSLISVRRRSGGAFLREQLAGAKILTKNMNTTHTGDFLISKMQVCHGATALVPEKLDGMHISGSYIALRKKTEDSVDMDFFNRLSATPEFYHLTFLSSYGVHIEKMTFNFKWFMKSKIKIPATLTEQKAIAEVLETADEEIRLLEAERDALSDQKKGLMQKLLTGEKRLPAFQRSAVSAKGYTAPRED